MVPGDRLRLEVRLGSRRTNLARAYGTAYLGDRIVAEAELLLGLSTVARDGRVGVSIHPTAIVHPDAKVGRGTSIGPYATISANVSIGRDCRIGASAVIDGWTEIGDANEIFPMASVGLIPQDLKFGGERTRLVIGNRNVIREFATIHRGTAGGGGLTRIGDHNLFMAYAHVAHDCQVGNETISATAPRSPATWSSRITRTSAPSPACTSSAASAAMRSSAATRSSPRTRCRSPRPSAIARASTA